MGERERILRCGRLRGASYSTLPGVEWVLVESTTPMHDLDAVVVELGNAPVERLVAIAERTTAAEVPLVVAHGNVSIETAMLLGRAGVAGIWDGEPEKLAEIVRAASTSMHEDESGVFRTRGRLERLLEVVPCAVWRVLRLAKNERWVASNARARELGVADLAALRGAYETEGVPVEVGLADGVRHLQLLASSQAGGETLVVGVDVSEGQQLRRAVRAAQRLEAVGRLAAGVAHDFNNILTVLSTYAEFLYEDLPEDSALREDVEVMREAIRKGTALAGQLLTFSRAREQALVPVAIEDVVRTVERLIRRTLGDVIQIDVSVATNEPLVVRADEVRLEQVLMNLAVNARDAMPEGGVLSIDVAPLRVDDAIERGGVRVPAGSYVSVRVRDTGTGMAPEVRARVFEPFFTTKAEQGSGLGLATTFTIVKELRGHILIESEVGVGTTFEILVPRAPAVSHPALRRRRVLLVGEEERVPELRERLAQLECELVVATSAEGALRVTQAATDVEAMLVDLPPMVAGHLVELVRRGRPDMAAVLRGGESGDRPGVRVVGCDESVDGLLDALNDALAR